MKLRLVVLISGSGSNLQAIIDATGNNLPAEICAVISNRDDAYGLERAIQAGIETRVLDHRPYPDRETYDQALIELIDSFQPGLVMLAGFMRILSPGLVQHYSGHLLNIHPSLLPKHKGLHTHQQAIDEGDKIHGASVHFVTEELDGGPVILQAQVPVEANDTAETLAARVLTQEHIIYPQAIHWFAEGRVKMNKGQVLMDGKQLNQPVIIS
ncbi:Phosphoribosylglycinamide formyltransferase [hydrothermal vent metagenome]|uniref:phosphoribosylglycinamide formyltransferase 1 n=1 Tax=hydrothermal vent metagenome TaxID=652676 RepID=A0A3B1B0F3_9ZZZZ